MTTRKNPPSGSRVSSSPPSGTSHPIPSVKPPPSMPWTPRAAAAIPTNAASGVARRGDEVEAEPLEVVVRAGEPRDLELTAVARARVDVADVERAAEGACDLRGEPIPDALEVGRTRDRLGHDPGADRRPELAEHASAPRRPARFLAKLAQHRLRPGQLVVEDPSRDVEEIADLRVAHRVADGRALLPGGHDVLGPQDGELLRYGRLVELEER